MTTGDARFNEVFFDDVFVPDDDVVGPVDGGWTVARATLGNERVSDRRRVARAPVGLRTDDLALRHGALDAESRAGDRPAPRRGAGDGRVINLRQATRAVTGGGAERGRQRDQALSAEHAQRVSELALRLCGTAAIIGDEPEIAVEYLFDRCLTIAGGTSEITRNVIAERILGLPRDPLVR